MYLPRKRKRNSIKARTWVASLATLACVGCANLGVKPWQRDVLAKPSMQLVADPLEAAIDDHIYFSKEAATGGRSFGGGGCGCN